MNAILTMAAVLATFTAAGLLTRGWALRIGGLTWMVLGAFAFITISVHRSNMPGLVLAGIFYGSLGGAMWVGGHDVHYRRTRRWKSRLARPAISTYSARSTRHDVRQSGKGQDRRSDDLSVTRVNPCDPR